MSQPQVPRSELVAKQLEVIRSARNRRRRAARWGWFLVLVAASVPFGLFLTALDSNWDRFMWGLAIILIALRILLWIPRPGEEDNAHRDD